MALPLSYESPGRNIHIRGHAEIPDAIECFPFGEDLPSKTVCAFMVSLKAGSIE